MPLKLWHLTYLAVWEIRGQVLIKNHTVVVLEGPMSGSLSIVRQGRDGTRSESYSFLKIFRSNT